MLKPASLLISRFNLLTRIELCSRNTSIKSSRILKWNAGVRIFRRLCHFVPKNCRDNRCIYSNDYDILRDMIISGFYSVLHLLWERESIITTIIITIQHSSGIHAQVRHSSVLPQDFRSASLHAPRMTHHGSWSTWTFLITIVSRETCGFILLRFEKINSYEITMKQELISEQ
jgi:hypothetical protein